MQLPNPFSVPLPRPSFTSETVFNQSNLTFNPGPGLPKTQSTSYNYSPSNSGAVSHKHNPNFRGFQPRSSIHFSSKFLPFSCDRCDRSFKSNELLQNHIAEHVVCGIDGCPFYAHPKIVAKHVEMQHLTGLALKIMQLNTPEEIERWREERKRKFPTAANVARRQAEQKERLQRGEILHSNPRRFPKTKGKQGCAKQPRKNGTQTMKQVQCDKLPGSRTTINNAGAIRSETMDSSRMKDSAKCGRVLSEGEIDSDEEQAKQSSSVKEKVNPAASSGLTVLMGSYASDSDPDVDNCIKTGVTPKNLSSEVEPNKKRKHLSGQRKKRKKKTSSERSDSKTLSKVNIPKKRLTLLQKLLNNEIRHERNVILQCVFYTVQKNFFAIGS